MSESYLDKSAVAEMLRDAMANRGYTQDALEIMSGVSQTTISRLIHEQVVDLLNPQIIRSLRKLAQALGLPRDYFHPRPQPDLDGQTLSGTIKSRRRALGITQLELAKRAGLGPGTIRRLEGDDHYLPGPITLERVADVLGLEVRYNGNTIKINVAPYITQGDLPQ